MGKNFKKDVWLIAYVNRDYIDIAQEELTAYDYHFIKAYIPTVKVLKKKFKGKNMFEFIPLLFNYGFFKVPYNHATNEDFLSVLRARITCIYGWVKDPTKDVLKNNPKLRMDNNGLIEAMPVTALATDKEIARLIKKSRAINVYSAEDLKAFSPGDYIKLKGYPFDNIPAEIIKINLRKREVKVKLLIDALVKEATVSFENVFYTVYQSLELDGKEKSLDEIKDNYGNNALDKILYENLDISDEY